MYEAQSALGKESQNCPETWEVGVKHNEAMGLVGWIIPAFSETFIES